MENYNTAIQALPGLPNAVNLWTDGSADYRNRSGGFAYIIQAGPPDYAIRSVYAQGQSDTTVSRMEITAALRGLESLCDRHIVQLITDSEYVAKSVAFWMEGWRRQGWKVKNGDLLRELYEAVHRHDVFVTKVLGHSGEALNEKVDALASQARKSILIELKD